MLIERHARPPARGFTLVETIMAIVIISVGLAGVLSVFNVNVQHSADPVVRKQLLAVAEEMLEEIALRPYDGATRETSTACERDHFDDVADYDGYPANGEVCDVAGDAIAELAGYELSVSVTAGNLEGAPGQRIEVTVTGGGEEVSLITWRTDFAE